MEEKENGFVNIHTSIISFLICVGLSTNVMFLMSLKADKSTLNYSEKIQAHKTVLMILTAIVYIPYELWVIQEGNATPDRCLLKGILQSFLPDSYPIGILAVAITRFRLAISKGENDLMANKRYFIIIISGSIGVSAVSSLSKLITALTVEPIQKSDAINSTNNFCYQVIHQRQNYANIFSLVLMHVIPAGLVLVLYIGIVYISTTSITRVQQHTEIEANNNNLRNLQNTPHALTSNSVLPDEDEHESLGRKIWKSIRILVISFLLSVVPTSIMEIYLNISESNTPLNIAVLYLKVLICILHAIGEGTFHFEKRLRTKLFITKYINRVSNDNTVTRRKSNENTVMPLPIFRPVGHLSTLNEVSTPSIETIPAIIENGSQSQDDVFDSVGSNVHNVEYRNEAFINEGSPVSSKHIRTVPKSSENNLTLRTFDRFTSSVSPKRTFRGRTMSTFSNFVLPSPRLNISPNRRWPPDGRSKSHDSLSLTPDSVISVSEQAFDFPKKLSVQSLILPPPRSRKTSVRTPDLADFEELPTPEPNNDELNKFRNSIRTISVISQNM